MDYLIMQQETRTSILSAGDFLRIVNSIESTGFYGPIIIIESNTSWPVIIEYDPCFGFVLVLIGNLN